MGEIVKKLKSVRAALLSLHAYSRRVKEPWIWGKDERKALEDVEWCIERCQLLQSQQTE
jgi:hypothetical protein